MSFLVKHLEAIDTPNHQLVSSKTEKSYTKLLETFISFINENSVNDYTSNIHWILLFFKHINERIDSKNQLWKYHSAINWHLKQKYLCLQDISGYYTLKCFLKNVCKGNGESSNVADVISDVVIVKIWMTMEEHGFELLLKCYFILSITNALRVDDAFNIRKNLITIDYEKKLVNIRIQNSKTGQADIVITNSDNEKLCAYTVFMRYYSEISKLSTKDNRFWLKWVKSGTHPKGGYFSPSQPIGINTMRNFMKRILSKYIDYLPEDIKYEEENKKKAPDFMRSSHSSRIGLERYTGHTARRSCATLAASVMNENELLKLGRWKSSQTAQRYIGPQVKKTIQEKLSDKLNGVGNEQSTISQNVGVKSGTVQFNSCIFQGPVNIYK